MRKIRTKYTKEVLNPVLEKSTSIGQVLDSLGLKRTGGNYRQIQKWINYWELDTSNFKGQGWSRGETKHTNKSVKRVTERNTYTNEQVFSENSPLHGSKIRNRLKEVLPYKCSFCGISSWRENALTLHVDHINGNHSDNRIENLRFLCPNCHQQTHTWGAKNKHSY